MAKLKYADVLNNHALLSVIPLRSGKKSLSAKTIAKLILIKSSYAPLLRQLDEKLIAIAGIGSEKISKAKKDESIKIAQNEILNTEVDFEVKRFNIQEFEEIVDVVGCEGEIGKGKFERPVTAEEFLHEFGFRFVD